MDIYEKIASNIKLTPQEMDLWRRSFAKNTRSGSATANLVHYETLASAKASVTINVPSSCDVLEIIGTGRIDQATGGVIWIQINGDTGNNYHHRLVRTDGTTVTTTGGTAQSHALAGVFALSGAAANIVGSFSIQLLHCYGSFHKNIVGIANDPGAGYTRYIGGGWGSTAPINTIEIYGTDNTATKGTANLAAGSVISAYQIR